MSIAMNSAHFVDSVLLMNSFAVSIDAISVEVSPICYKMFPPDVNYARFGSAFSGQISVTDLLYVAVFLLVLHSF